MMDFVSLLQMRERLRASVTEKKRRLKEARDDLELEEKNLSDCESLLRREKERSLNE